MTTIDVTIPASRVLAEAAELLPDKCRERRPNSDDIHRVCVRAALAAGVTDIEAAHRCADHAGRVLANHLLAAGLSYQYPNEEDTGAPTWTLVARWIPGRGLTEVLATMRGLTAKLGGDTPTMLGSTG